MSKTNQVNFKCDDLLFQKLMGYAQTVERTLPDFVRLLVEASAKMVDDPAARIVPPVIQDVIDRNTRTALLLEPRQDGLALAAEHPPIYKAKRRRG